MKLLMLILTILFSYSQYFILNKYEKRLCRFSLIYCIILLIITVIILLNLNTEPTYSDRLAYMPNELIIALIGVVIIVSGVIGCMIGWVCYVMKNRYKDTNS